ncbi:MAG: Crp/Fnr family transcriptional regulator [Devosiaceae bacterium]|nr:Crp/Fnr family transcriptional regulator [Devosiaceae bacterium]
MTTDVSIFERGDPVRSFYRVESGVVHLVRRQENGNVFILQRAYSGSVLGEASLFTSHYHCSAVAVDTCVLKIYSTADVKKLIEGDVKVALAYAEYLGKQLRDARLRSEITSLRRVSERLDAWLIWHQNSLPEKGTWNRVADEIGVSPEALYRELARRR